LIFEAGFLALMGVLLGTVLSFGLLIGAQRFVVEHFGIVLSVIRLRTTELEILAGIVLSALAMGAIPAWRAYRNSLADGLTIRT
jgi:putative ABC transport system permease protein